MNIQFMNQATTAPLSPQIDQRQTVQSDVTPRVPVFSHPKIFRVGGMGNALSEEALPSGFEALDRELSGGGWQKPGLTELLTDHVGIGELSLLLRALGAKKNCKPGEAAHLLWVIPPGQAWLPWVPYAPALVQNGIDLTQLAIVRTKNTEDALWAAEQGLKSGACRAVLMRLAEARCSALSLRRLQQAAAAGNSIMWLLRPREAATLPSPAGTRIALQAAQAGAIKLDILKRRGLAQGKSLTLTTRTFACLTRDAIPVRPTLQKGEATRWLDRVLSGNVVLTETLAATFVANVRERSFTRERG